MNNSWESIWGSRSKIKLESGLTPFAMLESLLKADGFDSPTGSIQASSFLKFTKDLVSKFDLDPNDSIFEIGCGAGAFLFPFYNLGYKVGGIDFSPVLIESAKSIFNSSDFFIQDANQLNIEPKYDYLVAFSVFFYFPDYEYAQSVLERMFLKAKKGVFILDVPNMLSREECETMRRGTMDKIEYDKKYKGLNHLYYEKSFFLNKAEKFQFNEIRFENQNIENYVNNDFRFNCFFRK
jgi:SAM-dependent methyltransferase